MFVLALSTLSFSVLCALPDRPFGAPLIFACFCEPQNYVLVLFFASSAFFFLHNLFNSQVVAFIFTVCRRLFSLYFWQRFKFAFFCAFVKKNTETFYVGVLQTSFCRSPHFRSPPTTKRRKKIILLVLLFQCYAHSTFLHLFGRLLPCHKLGPPM